MKTYVRKNSPQAVRLDAIRKALDRFGSGADDSLANFVALFDAIRPSRPSDVEIAVENYTTMLSMIEKNPVHRENVRRQFLGLVESRNLVTFLTDSGILPNTGFFSELWRIVANRILPEVYDERYLKDCLRRIYHRHTDWLWLEGIPPECTRRFWQLIESGDTYTQMEIRRILEQFLAAVLILADRVSTLGVEPELVRIDPMVTNFASPFLVLASEAHLFVSAYRASLENQELAGDDGQHVLVILEQCHDILRRARRSAMSRGTSLRLTFILARCEQSLNRLESLLEMLSARFRTDVRDAALHRHGATSRVIRSAPRPSATVSSPFVSGS